MAQFFIDKGKEYVNTAEKYVIVNGKNGYESKIPRSGEEFYNDFKNRYGNVTWKLNSVDDIFADPTRMVGYTETEMEKVLGDGWKFLNGDISVFYHPEGGIHGGEYWGISSGPTGKIKVADYNTYMLPDWKERKYLLEKFFII